MSISLTAIMNLNRRVLMATYQTWPTLNFAFSDMFAHAVVLFDILQNKSFEMQFCMARVEEFCICIEGQRERFDQIYS